MVLGGGQWERLVVLEAGVNGGYQLRQPPRSPAGLWRGSRLRGNGDITLGMSGTDKGDIVLATAAGFCPHQHPEIRSTKHHLPLVTSDRNKIK